MELTIITPAGASTYQIAWCEVDTPAGNFIIQEGHAPTILIASPGNSIIYCLLTEAQVSVSVVHAILHITRTSIIILLQGP